MIIQIAEYVVGGAVVGALAIVAFLLTIAVALLILYGFAWIAMTVAVNIEYRWREHFRNKRIKK